MDNLDVNIRIKNILKQESEAGYKDFSSALIPGCNNMYGIRIPRLRILAKEIAKGDFKTYLYNACDDSFEEVMLQGLVIGYIKTDTNTSINDIIDYAKAFIPKIDNWSVNDGFCMSFKLAKRYQKEVWEFIMSYIDSDREFELRVVAVMMMSYYLNDEYIDRVLAILNSLKHDGYYLKMGVAWALATAYAKYPNKVKTLLKDNELDDITHNKAIQKMRESYRISDEDKIWLKSMKR